MEELINAFSIEKVHKAGTRIDPERQNVQSPLSYP
jgi:hypothetical protein